MLHISSVLASLVVIVVFLVSQATAALANIPDSLSSWLNANPISTQKVTIPIRSSNRTLSSAAFYSQRSRCPASCDEAGLNPANWTVYHDLNRLQRCNETMLLDFNLYSSLDKPSNQATIRSCATSLSTDASNVGSTPSGTCPSKGNRTQSQEPLQIAINQTANPGSLEDFTAATQHLGRYLAQQESGCNASIAYAYSGSSAVGFFAGSGTQNISANVLEEFITEVQKVGISGSVLVQLCAAPERNRSSKYSLGIIANANTNLGSVQDIVSTWASGNCVTDYDTSYTWQNVTLSVPSLQSNATSLHSNTTSSNSSSSHLARALSSRASPECTAIQVVSGDSCASLASECGITPAEFTEYNPSSTLCSTLTVGEHVCCSAGSLPDYAPSPYANGTCYTYLVASGDSCSALAASYSITTDNIADWNSDTWGWVGCADLQAGYSICLSSGSPPMPAPIANAICGPQVPGTVVVPAGTNLTTLNQCPLNACCDIFGQCGTTAEFCTITESVTGAPGTAAAGTNGCISNCGTDIIMGDAPAEYLNIAWFEGFDTSRPCLNEPITALDLSPYTHVVLAFAAITPDFDLDITEIQASFEDFVSLTGNFKKIISIGGWAFSTDPSTYMIFRDAVMEANWDTFAENIVSFLAQYGLDGVNLDWEYPGEPDIPGIPAGSLFDGVNYSLFLDVLYAKITTSTEISVCAPASFWYLQGFEIQAMSEFLDYVIFMTYDIHGQWDYGSIYSDPGCDPSGCLRSDVNLTETLNAVSMITKAGVNSNQIVMGVTSYGRSFQMSTAGCYTEECLFTGPASGAYAGLCTQTAGYIANAEINSIIDGNGSVMGPNGDVLAVTTTPLTYLDESSYSNIVVYDDTQWIGYMDAENKAARLILYQGYNLGGTTDWAIDLQNYTGDSGSGGGTVISVPPSIWTNSNPTITCDPPCVLILPPYPLGGLTETITWPILTTTLLSLSAGSITVTITTTISVPSFTITNFSLQPITLSGTDTSTYEVNPVQSITPPSFIITLGPDQATFPPSAIYTPSVSVVVGQGGGGGGGGEGGPSANGYNATGALFGVTFYSTSIPVTIQPQPTYSITTPPLSKPIPAVTISSGAPTSTCTSGCGSRDCGIFGCKPDCGIFGCDGGCSVFGCGGGCGIFGCEGDCPLDICGGLDCLEGGCGDGDADGDENEDCDEPSTVSACTYIVSVSSTSTTTKTHCATYVACSTEDTVTTTTETTSEPQQSASETLSLYDIVASTGAADMSIIVSLASAIMSQRAEWDATRYSGLTVATSTSGVTVPTSTSTLTATTSGQPTISTSAVVPTPTAACNFYDEALFYTFDIFNIAGWDVGNGDSLHTQEDGCGDLTGWKFTEATSTEDAYASFNIDFFIKSGCIERAIKSAGGPSISCVGKGVGKRALELDGRAVNASAPSAIATAINSAGPGMPPEYSEEETEAFRKYYSGLNQTSVQYVPINWGTATASASATLSLVYVDVHVNPDESS